MSFDLHNAAIARLEAELAASEVRERQKAQSYAELERMYQAAIEDKQNAVTQSAAEVVRAAQAGLDAYALYEAMSEAVTCCRGVHYVDIEGEAEAEACELWIALDDKLRAFEDGEHPGAQLHAELTTLRAAQTPTTTNPLALVPAEDERAAVLCELAAARLRRRGASNTSDTKTCEADPASACTGCARCSGGGDWY